MNEMKKIVTNASFWAGGGLLTVLIMVSGQPYIETLLRAGYSVEGIGWVEAFRFCITNEKGLLFVPVCVPLAAGAYAEYELRSRYALYCCSRIGRKRYYVGKVMECALPGGLMVSCSDVLVLCFLYARLWEVPSQAKGIGVGAITAIILSGMLLGFLNGAFWALLGSVSAVLTRNKYLAYTMPFVIYYVMTMFQSRYYQELYCFSPRYWAAPVRYGSACCMIVLFSLCVAFAFCHALAVKRRLDHA